MSGKKCYDLDLLKQIRDDPMSKIKPDIPMLETCKVVRVRNARPSIDSIKYAFLETPVVIEHLTQQETLAFTAIPRPINDALFPSFAKGPGVSRNMGPRDLKKDGRNIAPSGMLPVCGASCLFRLVCVCIGLAITCACVALIRRQGQREAHPEPQPAAQAGDPRVAVAARGREAERERQRLEAYPLQEGGSRRRGR